VRQQSESNYGVDPAKIVSGLQIMGGEFYSRTTKILQ